MSLTKEQIIDNKNYFVGLLKKLSREGIDKLIEKLENSDFFFAPASTQYYGNYDGGLCEHSIEVFINLANLVESKLLGKTMSECPSLFESTIVVGLLHDICKMNRYEKGVKNVKTYRDDGSKQDSFGKYDWETIETYNVRENRFVYGTDGETSEYIIRQFIPLSLEESIAIINSKGDNDNNSNRGVNLSQIFNKYDLPVLLHCADLLACYMDFDKQERAQEKYLVVEDEQDVT